MHQLIALHNKSKHSLMHPCEHPKEIISDDGIFKRYNDTSYLNLNEGYHSAFGNIIKSAFGIARIEQFGDKKYLHHAYANSGNLHTCEIYVILNNGHLYHYNIITNTLELIKIFSLPPENKNYFILITGLIDRQSMRYGDRGFRYSLLDMGHALGALIYSASQSNMLLQRYYFTDTQISSILNLHHEMKYDVSVETEIGMILQLSPNKSINSLTDLLFQHTDAGFLGVLQPSRLQRFYWDFSRKIMSCTDNRNHTFLNPITPNLENPILRTSAKKFNTNAAAIEYSIIETFVKKSILYLIEILTHPCYENLRLEYILIVHNISGLIPGIYKIDVNYMDHQIQVNFDLVKQGNHRDESYYLSCFQDVCKDGDFQLMILNKIWDNIKIFETGFYRDIYYVCGVLAHILQIESLRYDIYSRPIGAFFDDEMKIMLDLNVNEYEIIHVIVFGQ